MDNDFEEVNNSHDGNSQYSNDGNSQNNNNDHYRANNGEEPLEKR